MDFTLYFRGNLKSTGKPRDKHKLRRHFHIQLRKLWNQLPLSSVRNKAINPNPEDLSTRYSNENLLRFEEISQFPSLIKAVGPFSFVPLVNERLNIVAELAVTLLRPEPPGSIITQGGDIDNRIKTLLDALKVPEENALPSKVKPESDENPFFCLLEDDKLVTGLSVSTDRLLEPVSDPSEVVLLIHVRTKVTVSTPVNILLS